MKQNKMSVDTALRILGAKAPNFHNRRFTLLAEKVELPDCDMRPIQAMVRDYIPFSGNIGLRHLLICLAATKKTSVNELMRMIDFNPQQKDNKELLAVLWERYPNSFDVQKYSPQLALLLKKLGVDVFDDTLIYLLLATFPMEIEDDFDTETPGILGEDPKYHRTQDFLRPWRVGRARACLRLLKAIRKS